MADRYWVGGGGTWSTSSTTNWSATSGGASGASVPTAADAVIVNGSSGSPTITLTGNLSCQSLTTTGATCTFTSTGSLAVSGNFTLSATTSWTATSAVTINANSTVTTNNIVMAAPLNIAGVGITVGLGSAYTCSTANTAGAFVLTEGTFNTNNFNMTLTCSGAAVFTSGSSVLTRAMNLGSSTVVATCSSTSSVYIWNCTTTTGFTFNSGTSSLTLIATTSNSLGVHGGGLTYYAASIYNTSTTVANNFGLVGANTWTNLVLTQDSSTPNQTSIFSIGSDQTISGLFITNPYTTGGNYRLLIYSSLPGTARTISVPAANVIATDTDFRDITKAGTGGNLTGTRLGDAGGNTGITFDAPKTVYWNNTANNQAWNSNSWAATSGGAVAVANFPLPQDTAVFSNTGTTNGNTIVKPASTLTVPTAYVYTPAAITATGMTNTTTLSLFTFTNCTFTDAIPITLSSPTFVNRSTQTLNASGPSYSGTLTLNSPTSAIVQLGATWNFNVGIDLNQGGFSLNGFDFTSTGTINFATGAGQFLPTITLSLGANTFSIGTFRSSTLPPRRIDFGTGNITCTGSGTAWQTAVPIALTYTGTPTINLTSPTTVTVQAGSTTGGAITNAFNFNRPVGTSFTLASGSIINNLDFTGFTGTWSPSTATTTYYGNLTLAAGMTYTTGTGVWTFAGTSGTQVLTSAGKTINPITKSGVGGTLQLADNASMNGGAILNSGTLDLNNNSLQSGSFQSNNSDTRAIAFGTGNITLVMAGASPIKFDVSTATNLTYTGTPSVTLFSLSGNFFTLSFGSTAGGLETNAFNFNCTGLWTLSITSGSHLKSLNFASGSIGGSFTGTWAPGASTYTFYGNLTLVPGMTFTTGTGLWTWANTSGTGTITSGGKTLYAITQNGVGGTVALGDAFVSNNTYTLTNGTFNASNQNFTTANFASSNANTRTLTMGSGNWTLSGTGTVWDTSTSTGLTVNPNTSTIVLSDTSTTARTFAGGTKTYNNLTIGGTTGVSTTSFTGSNTFNTLASTKTVAHTVTLPAGGTTTVANWTINGTAGNVVTLNSSSAGTQATLNKTSSNPPVSANYLAIQDSSATPAYNTWYALRSTNNGNNTGWNITTNPTWNTGFFFFM